MPRSGISGMEEPQAACSRSDDAWRFREEDFAAWMKRIDWDRCKLWLNSYKQP